MSRILNLGSINIDHVYAVDHFVRPGETLASRHYQIFAGGKGFNQSIALARAGAPVAHLGCIGQDGEWLLKQLAGDGASTEHVSVGSEATGHAMIQISSGGENAIVLHAGANHGISKAAIELALQGYGAGDWLLTQNETNAVGETMCLAKARGLKIAFNPAPMTDAVHGFPLELVDLFILNETEAEALAGAGVADVGTALRKRYPGADILLTLGAEGAQLLRGAEVIRQVAEPVDVVDTTAAGDTFIGYFLAEILAGSEAQSALTIACHAAGIAVTRVGASDSIPRRKEL
ncbi:ribokinase [Cerasicoccus fimbriatus]|uniref:ribokinase n=1 Tax=Cerasicoccus fimbriatus TaxID=3014554 RepID=UPI0022B59030|nr:ribokinase [Cerasicoccus sp. TK19100]